MAIAFSPGSPAPAFRRADAAPVGWAHSPGLIPYDEAVALMEARAAAIAAGQAEELVWLLEHPPLYTAGVSAKADDLLQPDRFPVHRSARGGQYTYHGPGQRIAYVMLDLTARDRDARAFVLALEHWIIAALAALGVAADTRCERVGVWVPRGDGSGQDDKIAAIGVKLRRWVSFHGVGLNVAPNLAHFAGIVPCGVTGHGVTSLERLGRSSDMTAADAALEAAFPPIFGPIVRRPDPLAASSPFR